MTACALHHFIDEEKEKKKNWSYLYMQFRRNVESETVNKLHVACANIVIHSSVRCNEIQIEIKMRCDVDTLTV